MNKTTDGACLASGRKANEENHRQRNGRNETMRDTMMELAHPRETNWNVSKGGEKRNGLVTEAKSPNGL